MEEKKTVLDFDAEVLKYATSKDHEQKEATTNTLGHVKVINQLQESSPYPVQSNVIYEEIAGIKDKIIEKGTKPSSYDGPETFYELVSYVLNENETINNNITSINNEVVRLENQNAQVDLTKLLNLSAPIEKQITKDEIIEPGFYKVEEVGNNITKKGLLFVIKNNEDIIQDYIDEKDYHWRRIKKANGTTWGKWNLQYMPPSTISNINIIMPQAKVTIHENTTGFIFKWEQLNENKEYIVNTNELYGYEEVCHYDELPIVGDFIFSNLIGKIDVKITSNKMEVRSTLTKGNKVKNINQSFFVPRVSIDDI